MFDYIEKLRKGPEAKKRRFVFGAASTITSIVVILWVVSLVIKINGGALQVVPEGQAGEEFEQKLTATKESWSQFMESLSNTFGSSTESTVPEEPEPPAEESFGTSTGVESFDTIDAY